jgi:ApbE superfamily uncharacterized protein (UPF0280 family)
MAARGEVRRCFPLSRSRERVEASTEPSCTGAHGHALALPALAPPSPPSGRGKLPRGGARGAFLADGRLHLNHGPIDLVVEAWGEAEEVRAAYAQAWRAFPAILPRLVRELALLRRPVDATHPGLDGPVARRMLAACAPLAATDFITPMAAVAGAVAEHVLAAMLRGRRLTKAYVNDGGDIALHLAPGETIRAGTVGDVSHPALASIATIAHGSPVRGIATSGWNGRSFSLGIADAVTVLAASAAEADAAATLVANAVDVDDDAVERAPATSLDPDSDLGARLVTVRVGALSRHAIDAALARGAEKAQRLRRAGRISAAVLLLRSEVRVVA